MQSAALDFDRRVINCRENGESFESEWPIRGVRNAPGDLTHFLAVQPGVSSEPAATLQRRLREYSSAAKEGR